MKIENTGRLDIGHKIRFNGPLYIGLDDVQKHTPFYVRQLCEIQKIILNDNGAIITVLIRDGLRLMGTIHSSQVCTVFKKPREWWVWRHKATGIITNSIPNSELAHEYEDKKIKVMEIL